MSTIVKVGIKYTDCKKRPGMSAKWEQAVAEARKAIAPAETVRLSINLWRQMRGAVRGMMTYALTFRRGIELL